MLYIKHFYLLIVILLFASKKSIGQNYANNLDSYNDSIKTIAIMPFKLFVGRNGQKTDTTAALEKEATVKKSFILQEKLEKWLNYNVKPANVTIQDAAKTDSLLHRTKLGFDALFGLNEGALCKFLGVDAVAYCDIKMSNPNYDLGDEITKEVVDGVLSAASAVPIGRKADNNITTFSMRIIDNIGTEVWKYTSEERWYTHNKSSEKLIVSFIDNITYKLPFVGSKTFYKRK